MNMQANLNRAQRRALKRGRLPMPERVVPLPSILDEFTVFDMPQSIIDNIKQGQINAYQGKPVFRDNAGHLCEVCPALAGWIETWQLINGKLGTNINLAPLSKIYNKLQVDMPLTLQDVAAAEETLNAMRQVFRNNDRSLFASIAKSAQIKILMEDMA